MHTEIPCTVLHVILKIFEIKSTDGFKNGNVALDRYGCISYA